VEAEAGGGSPEEESGIAQAYPRHRWTRQRDWLLHETDDPAAVLRLGAIGCEPPPAAAYEGVAG
jgi:hypothetical protein